MYHQLHQELSPSINWLSTLLTLISAGAAAASSYFAYRSFKQSSINQIPVLRPEIIDPSNPNLVRLKIVNIGNSIAKNVVLKVPAINETLKFESDLVPRQIPDYQFFTADIKVNFENGNNPLFSKEMVLTYEDSIRGRYSMKAKFKPDAVEARKLLGHVDINFSGIFYQS